MTRGEGRSRVLVVFAVVLGPTGTAVVPGAVAGPAPVSVASDPTAEEQEALRQVAGAIRTPEPAAGWTMNSDVADVLSTATGEVLVVRDDRTYRACVVTAAANYRTAVELASMGV